MEIDADIQDAPGAIELSGVRGTIEFRNVNFTYRNGGDHILRNLDLTIRAGEYVALVGFSGVGKTTLCSLIPASTMSPAGRSCSTATTSARSLRLRRRIGPSSIRRHLLPAVADNIRYGRPDATPEEIVAAARLANAHDFIVRLPNGYETDIGQRGVRLSGGQKQRLSIARAFLKDPPVLILDEATSSLDNESERAIQASLDRLARSRTTIVIAHRLSTVRNARRIIVLDGTGIVEEGTHAGLIARGGVYASLYNSQLEFAP